MLKNGLTKIAEQFGERVLETKLNKMSIGVSLSKLSIPEPTFFGSYLFSRRISGIRVVVKSGPKEIAGSLKFINYGSSHNEYPHLPYFTCAAAIG